jgi:hypothetical protein
MKHFIKLMIMSNLPTFSEIGSIGAPPYKREINQFHFLPFDFIVFLESRLGQIEHQIKAKLKRICTKI